jgi:hypothetical protein
MKSIKCIVFLVLFLTALSCRKPYLPLVAATDTNLLVVEGVINPGADSTIIRLSHTVKLEEKTGLKPETGATVTVVGEGVSYNLTEGIASNYAAINLNLNSAQKYRLKIHTAGNQDYLSDEMEVKITPPIDTLTYKVEADGLHFYSAAHDPSNNTRYYRWDYQEAWRFTALFESKFKVLRNDAILPRVLPQDDIFQCYGSSQSGTILLGTSAKIAQDIISNNPITQTGVGAEKTGIRYSILLRQYALSKEAYSFWENLKKNTEQLGSIFDALPSEIQGNIHSVNNPETPVIGYMSISTVTTKRIYVNRMDLPFTPEWRTKYPFEGCRLQKALFEDYLKTNTVESNILNAPNYPVTEVAETDPLTGVTAILGYYYTARECTDCTIRGTIVKPGFWADK